MNVLSAREACQDIKLHPYIDAANVYLASKLIEYESFYSIVSYQCKLLKSHEERPIDALIGDDVTGRVPTLLTHNFLLLARAAGHIESIPKTFFMTSGRLGLPAKGEPSTRQTRDKWENNLTNHAADLIGRFALGNVLIVTEVISTGISVERLEDAFKANGANAFNIGECGGDVIWSSGAQSKHLVGVEKNAPQPISQRHSRFSGAGTTELRGFFSDYAGAVYRAVYHEKPPLLPWQVIG